MKADLSKSFCGKIGEIMEGITLEQMLGTATGLGYGTKRQLRSTFRHFQERGLLGLASGKDKGRGAAGLWHPFQKMLWKALLQRRRDGERLLTMHNLPIVLWLHGYEGIDTLQAQLCWCRWARELGSDKRPDGRESLIYRATMAMIHRISPGKVRRPDAAALRKALELQRSGGLPSPDYIVNPMATVLAGQPKQSAQQRQMAHFMKQQLDKQVKAIELVEVFNKPTPDTLAFWNWVPKYYQHNHRQYKGEKKQLKHLPEVGHLFQENADIHTTARYACTRVAETIADGVEILISPDFESRAKELGLPLPPRALAPKFKVK